MMTPEEILSTFPSVKLGLDDHYGQQTVLRAMEAYHQHKLTEASDGDLADVRLLLAPLNEEIDKYVEDNLPESEVYQLMDEDDKRISKAAFKAGASNRSFNELELLAEDLECVKMWLNDKNIPTHDKDNNQYSVIGRIELLLNGC